MKEKLFQWLSRWQQNRVQDYNKRIKREAVQIINLDRVCFDNDDTRACITVHGVVTFVQNDSIDLLFTLLEMRENYYNMNKKNPNVKLS